MKRSQKVQPVFKGEITAFLALIFLLMLSVVGALIESASIQITKSRKRADTMLALESVFAEYHREMLEQYDVFVHMGSNEEVLRNRLEYYGATGVEHNITRAEVLTDHNGEAFYRQAVHYTKDLLGLDELFPDERYQFDTDSTVQAEEMENKAELEHLLQQEEAELPTEDNPIQSIENLKQSPLLTILTPNPEELSNRSIQTETLPSNRELLHGNFESQPSSGVADKMFFVEYLTSHFTNMLENDESHTLLYELEYLLEGKGTDQENLEAVCEKILWIRTALNYVYLLTDSAKQAEAEMLAIAMCNVLTVTGISVLVKQALLFAWAYGESIVDVRALLKGKTVAVVKTSETWQLQLSNLIKLGTEEEVTGEKEVDGGLSYEDYLKGLLLLEEKETLCMRGLDLIESNLQIKTDQCMTKVEIKSRVELRHGIQETFLASYGYQ